MMHILHGIDPWQLTRMPYVAVTSRHLRRSPRDLGWTFQEHGSVESLPLISAYVGADTVGMIVALDLDREKATTLSIDIGTNGEMVLARAGSLLATSTAAGPAFEGAQIACGMRALPGAIVAVRIGLDGSVSIQTVGNAAPQGMCGTGLVSAVAQLLEHEVLDATGRLLDAAELTVPSLRERLFSLGGEPAFALSEDRRVYISQKDIRTLQLAKGAVRTGIDTLLDVSGISADGLDALRLARQFWSRPGCPGGNAHWPGSADGPGKGAGCRQRGPSRRGHGASFTGSDRAIPERRPRRPVHRAGREA